MRIYRYRLRLAERYKTLRTISKAQRDISADAVYIVCAKSQFRVERYEVVYIYNFINIGKRAMLLQQLNQILASGNILNPCGDKFLKPHNSSSSSIPGV